MVWIAMNCLESLVDRKAMSLEMPRVAKQKHEGHWNLESLFRRFFAASSNQTCSTGRDQTWGTDNDSLCLVGVQLFNQGIHVKKSSWIIFFPGIQKSHSMQGDEWGQYLVKADEIASGLAHCTHVAHCWVDPISASKRAKQTYHVWIVWNVCSKSFRSWSRVQLFRHQFMGVRWQLGQFWIEHLTYISLVSWWINMNNITSNQSCTWKTWNSSHFTTIEYSYIGYIALYS